MTKKNKLIQFKRRPQPGPTMFLPGFVKPDLSNVRLVQAVVEFPHEDEEEEQTAQDVRSRYTITIVDPDDIHPAGEAVHGDVYDPSGKSFTFSIAIGNDAPGLHGTNIVGLYVVDLDDDERRVARYHRGNWEVEPTDEQAREIVAAIIRALGTPR